MEENASTPTVNLYQHAAKFGAILGGIFIVVTVLAYVIDVSFMASFKFLGLSLVIFIGVVIYSGINYRNAMGGFLPYGKAFIYCVVCMVTAGVVGLVFNILLYHVIDTDLTKTMTDTIVQNTEAMMTKFGAPQDKIDETISKMRDEMPAQFSVGGLILSFLEKTLITYAIISLIVALFVRKNEPVEV